MAKWFINPRTGQTVQYPDHFAQLKPYLIEVVENPICEKCMDPAEPLDEFEAEFEDAVFDEEQE